MPINERTNGFVGAGVGITHFSLSLAGYSSESELSFSLSGGYKYGISKHLGLRLGFRFYGTPVSKNTAIFCGDGACNIRFSSNLFTQYEANAGLIIKF